MKHMCDINTNCYEIIKHSSLNVLRDLPFLSSLVFKKDYEGLWEEDGCYNTSLYQKTAGYHTYQQVFGVFSCILFNWLFCLKYFFVTRSTLAVFSSQLECQ